jgi:hypothetical protein
MLTEPGKYWLAVALFAEFARTTNQNEANTVELGLLMRKGHMNWLHTLNVFWEKEVRSKAEPIDTGVLRLANAIRLNQYFQPGFEVYGEIEDVTNPGRFNQQQFRIGPMLHGSTSLANMFGTGKLVCEAGHLFGATSETEKGTFAYPP